MKPATVNYGIIHNVQYTTMNVIETDIEGVKIIEPKVFGDARGWFCEHYNAERYKAAGIMVDFVQDNESCSSREGLPQRHIPHPR